MKIASILSVLFGLIMMIFGGYELISQHRMMTNYLPVQAVIISSELQIWSDDYTPRITYKFEVRERSYISKNVFPSIGDTTKSTARNIVAKFKPDDEVDAWYDSENPSDSFLIRQYDFMPYGMLLFGVFVVSGSIAWFIQLKRNQRRLKGPRLLPDGWHQLEPPSTLTNAVREFGVAGLGWIFIGALVSGHYFLMADRPYSTGSLIGTGVYSLIGVILFGLCGWAWWLSRWLDDACVLVNLPRAIIGEILMVRVEQEIYKPATVKTLSVELVCEEVKRVWINLIPTDSKKKIWSEKKEALVGHQVQAGEIIAADFEIQIPVEMHPTTPPKKRGYPRYLWTLKQNTRLRGVPPSPDAFIINVDEELVEVAELEE